MYFVVFNLELSCMVTAFGPPYTEKDVISYVDSINQREGNRYSYFCVSDDIPFSVVYEEIQQNALDWKMEYGL